MSETTTLVIGEVKQLKSGTTAKGSWTLYGIVDGNEDIFATTFDSAIYDTAKQYEGQKAEITYDQDDKGKKIISVKPAPADTNGSTPSASTGTRAQTAPGDAARMARGAAWKAVTNEGFVKAAMAVYSAEQPGDQLTSQKLHDLLAKHALKISNNIMGDEAIPF